MNVQLYTLRQKEKEIDRTEVTAAQIYLQTQRLKVKENINKFIITLIGEADMKSIRYFKHSKKFVLQFLCTSQ